MTGSELPAAIILRPSVRSRHQDYRDSRPSTTQSSSGRGESYDARQNLPALEGWASTSSSSLGGDTQPARPARRQKAAQIRHLSPLKWSSLEDHPLEWDVHVERALNSQQLSQSWSEIVREKHTALEAALREV